MKPRSNFPRDFSQYITTFNSNNYYTHNFINNESDNNNGSNNINNNNNNNSGMTSNTGVVSSISGGGIGGMGSGISISSIGGSDIIGSSNGSIIHGSLDFFNIIEHNDNSQQEDDEDFDPSLLPLPEHSTKAATQRIYRELKMIVDNQNKPSNDLGFYIVLDKLKSVYQWVVQLRNFDPNIPLAQDMARYNVTSIDLEVRFSPDFPNLPPYIRVIRPRLLRFLRGGGGHITAGGSICIEILTMGNRSDKGWSPEFTIESVLLQVKLALSDLSPPARLDSNWKVEYSPREAMDAYVRVARQHGWVIPPQWSTLFRH